MDCRLYGATDAKANTMLPIDSRAVLIRTKTEVRKNKRIPAVHGTLCSTVEKQREVHGDDGRGRAHLVSTRALTFPQQARVQKAIRMRVKIR